MKRFILPLLIAAITLTALVACGSSSSSKSPLGNLPNIIAELEKQYKEHKDAKQTKVNSAKSFEKMMGKEMEFRNNAAKKVEKEGARLQGRTIPCVGGDEAFDFIKIKEAVIDKVYFDRLSAVVQVKFIPDGENNGGIEDKIYFVFLDKDGNKIQKSFTSASYLTGDVKLGRLNSVPPERWNDLKEIRFLPKEEYNQL